jgi:hypothetical protein
VASSRRQRKNQSGNLCIDSVHQVDQEGLKGVYYIEPADCVVQYEAVATCTHQWGISHARSAELHSPDRARAAATTLLRQNQRRVGASRTDTITTELEICLLRRCVTICSS